MSVSNDVDTEDSKEVLTNVNNFLAEIKEVSYYSDYFQYLRLIDTDQIDEAEEFHSQMMEKSPDFIPKYANPDELQSVLVEYTRRADEIKGLLASKAKIDLKNARTYLVKIKDITNAKKQISEISTSLSPCR
jgi:hypothetical protein